MNPKPLSLSSSRIGGVPSREDTEKGRIAALGIAVEARHAGRVALSKLTCDIIVVATTVLLLESLMRLFV
jgi:hypothetical protein